MRSSEALLPRSAFNGVSTVSRLSPAAAVSSVNAVGAKNPPIKKKIAAWARRIGLAAGYALVTLVLVVGVGPLVTGVPFALTALTIAGACYLTYLGVRTLRTRADVPTGFVDPHRRRHIHHVVPFSNEVLFVDQTWIPRRVGVAAQRVVPAHDIA